MHDYLIDREALAKFVDELIKNKPQAASSPEELENLKESAIMDLDKKITAAIFGSFTEEQRQDYQQLLDNTDAGEEELDAFLERNNINLEQIVTATAEEFAKDFLKGGQDA